MLFLANTVQDNGENSTEYDNLRKLSVRIIPKAISNIKVDLDQDYKRGHEVNSNTPDTKNNYYFTKFIYDKTGYHNEEYYRLYLENKCEIPQEKKDEFYGGLDYNKLVEMDEVVMSSIASFLEENLSN